MLPEHPEVFLVETDRVGDRQRAAVVVVDDTVEVLDRAEAVAAELEAVAHHPHAVLAHVEHVLAVVGGRRVAVGDEHLSEGSAVEDRPLLTLVVVADGVEHHPFARVEADAEAPLLPGDAVPLDLEAGALGLRYVKRFQVLSHALREAGVVVGGGDLVRSVVGLLGRDRHHAVVLDVDDLHFVQVEFDDQALDRARIDVLARPGADPGQGPAEAALLGGVVIGVETGRPGVGDGQVEIGDPTAAESRLPARILPDHVVHGYELFEHDRGLDVLDLLPADDLLLGQGDDRLEGLSIRAIADDDKGLPVELGPVSLLRGQNVLLGRLVQHHVDESLAGVEASLLLEDRGSRLDLFCCQRVQWMPGRRDRFLYGLHMHLQIAALPGKGGCRM